MRVHCTVVVEQRSMQAARCGSIVKNCDRHCETQDSCASLHAAAAMHAAQTVGGCAAAMDDQRHPLSVKMRIVAFTAHSVIGASFAGTVNVPCGSLPAVSWLLARCSNFRQVDH